MVRIVFKDLKIEDISNASGIFSGHNFQFKWRHTEKSNEGHGDFSGDKNIVRHNKNTVIDTDVFDQWIKKQHSRKK